MDPFWEVDRPQRQQPQPDNEPGPSSRQMQHTPMEEGEIDSETDQDPSVLEVPVNWAKYVGVKGVQYIKMGHAPKVDSEEPIGTLETQSGRKRNNFQRNYNC